MNDNMLAVWSTIAYSGPCSTQYANTVQAAIEVAYTQAISDPHFSASFAERYGLCALLTLLDLGTPPD